MLGCEWTEWASIHEVRHSQGHWATLQKPVTLQPTNFGSHENIHSPSLSHKHKAASPFSAAECFSGFVCHSRAPQTGRVVIYSEGCNEWPQRRACTRTHTHNPSYPMPRQSGSTVPHTWRGWIKRGDGGITQTSRLHCVAVVHKKTSRLYIQPSNILVRRLL